jgi:protoheme IX farnesyltransferase
MAGFWLGSKGPVDAWRMANMVLAVATLAAGIFALNQYMERDLDGLMRRTAARPLPAGRLRPAEALWFGVILSTAAVVYLALSVNLVSALIALMTVVSYVLMYTPLKKVTPHATALGALPGATPPLLGWAAASGELGISAWLLFAILFLWQFPHFHSIAMLYQQDYSKAGIRVWTVTEPEGKTIGRQITAFTALLVPVSLLPSLVGVTGGTYLLASTVLGVLFFGFAIGTSRSGSRSAARRLLLVSVVYLPLLFAVMVLDKQ